MSFVGDVRSQLTPAIFCLTHEHCAPTVQSQITSVAPIQLDLLIPLYINTNLGRWVPQYPSFGTKICTDIFRRALSVRKSKLNIAFPIPKLGANCKLWGTDNVQEQIFETSIFLPQMEAIVLIILQLFFAKRAIF